VSEALHAQRRARFFAFVVVLLDATAYFFLVRACWFAVHEPATRNFDIVAGLVVSFFFCMSAIPALILLLLRAQSRTALLFALGFPVACVLAFAAGIAIFTWA
jgi:hypothetical protein